MKKFLSLLLALVMMTALVPAAMAEESITIIWHTTKEAYENGLAANPDTTFDAVWSVVPAFEEKYGVKVDVRAVAWGDMLSTAVSMVNNGYTNPNPATQTRYDLQDMFGAGKLAMVIAPNQLPTYLADKGYTINFATAGLPHNEGATGSSVGVMDRIMAFKDDSFADQAARNEAIGKFLTFFYNPENYVGWVSMEGFLPAVNSAVGALIESDASFGAWLDVLNTSRFYPAATAGWDDVKTGVINVEQNALTGGNVQELLDALQAELTK